MTQRVFEPKVLTLIGNVEQSVTWGVQEFGKYFSQYDAIIRGNVGIRFQVQNVTPNVIYLSLNYSTLYETIPFQERKNLAAVASNTTVELSKATVPAIGLLKTDITSITLTVVGPSNGTVRITLLILDAEDLASENSSSALLGSDTALETEYTAVNTSGTATILAVSIDLINFTVPASRRFILDCIDISCDPTPSYPGDVILSVRITIAGLLSVMTRYSKTDQFLSERFWDGFGTILSAGDNITVRMQNNVAILRTASAVLIGRTFF